MAKTEVISTKVDLDIKNRLAAIANETGKSESEIVRDFILEGLGETSPDSVRSLVSEVRELKQKCNRLVKAVFT